VQDGTLTKEHTNWHHWLRSAAHHERGQRPSAGAHARTPAARALRRCRRESGARRDDAATIWRQDGVLVRQHRVFGHHVRRPEQALEQNHAPRSADDVERHPGRRCSLDAPSNQQRQVQ